jgi:hypothetical protein
MQGKLYNLAAIFLMAIILTAPARAQEPTRDLVNLDFADAAVAERFQLNGSAQWVMEDGRQRLRLTDDFGQGASAFLTTPLDISNYLATFDFQVTRVEEGDDPADGFVWLAQTAGANRIGTGGGGLGFTFGDNNRPPRDEEGGGFPGYSYGIEFNTYAPQGLPDAAETVGLNLFGMRTRLGQTAFPHIDQGVFRAQVRVTPERLTLTVSGGNNNAEPRVLLTSPDFLARANYFQTPAPLYFGFTGGTGGLQQRTDILNLRIQVPEG